MIFFIIMIFTLGCLIGIFISLCYFQPKTKIIEVGQKDYIYRLKALKMFLEVSKRTYENALTIEPFDDDILVKMIEKFEYQINQIDFLIREK